MLRRFLRRVVYALTALPTIFALVILLTSDSFAPRTTVDKVRVITAPYEFEFISWTANALWAKTLQFSLGDERYLTTAAWHDLVVEYDTLLNEISAGENELARIFADPGVADPMAASTAMRADLAAIGSRNRSRPNCARRGSPWPGKSSRRSCSASPRFRWG
jgi:hypothetical protein